VPLTGVINYVFCIYSDVCTGRRLQRRRETETSRPHRAAGDECGGVDVTTDAVTETILSINSRLYSAMQVSCGKLTVNDGMQMAGTT